MAHSEKVMCLPADPTARTRRRFLSETAVLAGSSLMVPAGGPSMAVGADDHPRRPKVAALFTHFTAGSHSDVILENFLEPYLFNGQRHTSPCDVVSFYIDKFSR